MADFAIKAFLFCSLCGVIMAYGQSGRPFIPSPSRRFFDAVALLAVFAVSFGIYIRGLRAYVSFARSLHDAELRAFAVSVLAAAVGALIGLVAAGLRRKLFRQL